MLVKTQGRIGTDKGAVCQNQQQYLEHCRTMHKVFIMKTLFSDHSDREDRYYYTVKRKQNVERNDHPWSELYCLVTA